MNAHIAKSEITSKKKLLLSLSTRMRCFITSISLGALAALILVPASTKGQVAFINPAPITINDSTNPPTKASPYPSSITVSGMSGLVAGLSVTLSNVNHTFPRDISALLVGPQGQSVVLMANAGGLGLTNVTLTFSDFASAPMPNQGLVPSSTYRPSWYGYPTWPAPAPSGPYSANLSAFNGTDPNGTWNLFIVDDMKVDAGNVAQGWRLTIVTSANLPPELHDVVVTPAVAEGGVATLVGQIADPNPNDNFVLSVNWGDALSNQNLTLPAGTTNFILTHSYADDGQTGTASDNLKVAVTLTDNGGASDDSFLSALFQDTLGRPFDPLQRGFYLNQIVQNGRENVAYLLRLSFEYRAKKVQDYYEQFLHRAANGNERDLMAAGPLTEKEMVAAIVASPEYFQQRAANDNSAWLDAVFFDLLGRTLSGAERTTDLALVAQNGRSAFANLLVDSAEFRQRLVEMWFQKFLRHAAGVNGGAYATALTSQSWERVAAQILGSQEYYNVRSGGTDSAVANVIVTNVAPTLSNVSIASPISEGGITSLSGQFADPGTNDTHVLTVTWGDGSPSQTVALAQGTRAFNVPHLFSVPHTTNLVHFTLTDDDTGVAAQTVIVIVNERAPRITSAQRQPGSITRLDCLGVPSRSYVVQASTNLSSPTNWINLGGATATANGTFTTYDMSPGNVSQRFYRLRSP